MQVAVILWLPGEDYKCIACLAGWYGSAYCTEMVAIYKSLESVFEKFPDSTITVRIYSDWRQVLRHLVEGATLQHEKIGCKIWEKLVAIIDRNTANAVQFLLVPGHAAVEGNECADKVTKDGSWRNQSQADIDIGGALHHLRQYTIQSWYNEFEKLAQNKPTGPANWHLRRCSRQFSPRTPPGIPRQAQRAIHQLMLNRLTSAAWQIPSPICLHCGSGEETAELLLFSPKWAIEQQQY